MLNDADLSSAFNLLVDGVFFLETTTKERRRDDDGDDVEYIKNFSLSTRRGTKKWTEKSKKK